MAEANKVELPPPQFITPRIFSVDTKKKLNKRYNIWVTAAVTIVVVVIMGFVLCGYFYSNTTKDIMKDHQVKDYIYHEADRHRQKRQFRMPRPRIPAPRPRTNWKVKVKGKVDVSPQNSAATTSTVTAAATVVVIQFLIIYC